MGRRHFDHRTALAAEVYGLDAKLHLDTELDPDIDYQNLAAEIFGDGVVQKRPPATVTKPVEKVSVHYNIGHLASSEGDTVAADGKWLVALNKWSLDRFPVIGTLKPQNFQLIGITDTSMLRPQVFALQEGEVQIGLFVGVEVVVVAHPVQEGVHRRPRALVLDARPRGHLCGGRRRLRLDRLLLSSGEPAGPENQKGAERGEPNRVVPRAPHQAARL